ncbi:MAG: BlaI/MecI/CopY family transcriptional regulator [Bacteroidales bacterium]
MKTYQPTENELKILQILWEMGPSSVREVHEKLGQHKDTGYTTTLKTMQIMTDKGLLTRDKDGRKHVYKAGVSREQTQQQVLGKMVKGLFEGSTSRLVMGALDNKTLSKDEVDEIKAYLKQFE